MQYHKDTIVAISTPEGRGAIGVIRVSGPDSLKVLGRLWKSRGQTVDKFLTHRIYLGNIADLSTGLVIDQVLASYFKAPASYTGEDIIEVSCHGGTEVLALVLGELVRAGARLAEPGEFTKRAFLNGKMDLAQAEAVAEIIDARSGRALKIAEEHLSGRLSEKIGSAAERLKKLLAFVEATIDFPEEDIEFIKNSDVTNSLESLKDDISALLATYANGRVIRNGVKTVIAGPPNAGKSSLMNALLGFQRAIVHHIPGTTRDTIEEEVVLDGVSFRLVDTAGIREAEEEVEEIGVKRSFSETKTAEAVLLVLDGHDPKQVDESFLKELESVRYVFVVINKKDMALKLDTKALAKKIPGREVFHVSATTGDGIKDLIVGINNAMMGNQTSSEGEGIIVTQLRHFSELSSALRGIESGLASVKAGEAPEFIATNLRSALENLGRITGVITTDDILNEIFSKFCIGK